MLDTLLAPYHLPDDYTIHRDNNAYMLKGGESAVLTDIDGPGCIRRVAISMQPKNLRTMVLRFYWDGEEDPSIECPVSDFFGIGHNLTTSNLSTMLFFVAPLYGYNCYIPMPFATGARITLTNEGTELMAGICYHMDYHQYEEPPQTPWRLHAAWRRVFPGYRRGENFKLLEARGDGRLLGVIYHVVKRDSDDRWTHGGGEQIFIDGDTARPQYVYGTGGEEFGHHCWGVYPSSGAFGGCSWCHPVPGVKRMEGNSPFEPHGYEQHDGGHYSIYRFYIPDKIRFRSSIRMTFGTCENEISSTTYWYQSEPHHRFSTLPALEQRRYGNRLAEETTYQPLALAGDMPTAVLGPMLDRPDAPWSGDRPLDLGTVYDNNLHRAYGDVVEPPYQVRWRRSDFRGGFIDLGAIHRPKSALRVRGIWNQRSLPLGSITYQLVRPVTDGPRRVVLRIGFDDNAAVWHNGSLVARLHRPNPKRWHTHDLELMLPGGASDVLISLDNHRAGRWSTWGLYARFLDQQLHPIDDLAFARFDDLDPTPERYRETWPPGGMHEDAGDFRDPALLV